MKRVGRPARINVKALVILVLVVGLLVGGAAVGHKVRRRIMVNQALAAGKAALETKDWAAACKHLRIYLSKKPDDVVMLARYAEANLSVRPREAKHIGAALGAYRRLLRDKPGDDEICEKLARLYLRVGNVNEAAYVCRQRLDADPADPDAALTLGRALIAQRKHDDAANVLRKLVEEHPHQVKAYVLLSTLAMAEDLVSAANAASQWLNQAVEANPQSPEARAQRARFRRIVRNDAVAAREDLEATEALQTDDPRVRLLLADEWMSLGDLDRAYAQLEALKHLGAETPEVHDLDPDDLMLAEFSARGKLVLLGGAQESGEELADFALAQLLGRRRTIYLPLAIELYLAGNDVDRADRCLDQYRGAVEEADTQSSAQRDEVALLGAIVAVAQGRPYDGINELEPLLARSPDNARAWRLLATAYERTGQWPRAIEAGEEYLKLAAGDFAMTLWLAEAHLRVRDLDEALRYARRAERVKPDHLEAKLLRIEIEISAIEAGSIEPARLGRVSSELATLVESGAEAGKVPILQAKIAALEGRTDDAVVELERALDAGDHQLAAATSLIRLYRRLDRQEEASEVCRRAMAIRADLAEPRILLARLQVEADRAGDAHDTLKAAVADLAGQERLEARVVLAEFMLVHQDRGEGISLLRKLAADHADNAQLRLVLLSLPDVQAHSRESQTLISELRTIEGERGLRWRIEQAKLWLRGEEWSQRQEEIEEMLTHCISADPGWSEPVVMLGTMHETLGRDDQAEEVYRQAIDSDPRHVTAATRLLKLLERQKRFADVDSVLQRMPADLPALGTFRAGAAIRRKEYDSAIEELQRQIDVGPDDGTARLVLAQLIYGYRKDVDAAFDLLTEAESLGSEFLAVSYVRVGILRAEGRVEEALELLNTEVDRRKDFAAYLLRARYYAETERLELAEKDYTHLTTLPESSADGFLLLGNFHYGNGKTDRAIAAWDAGLEAVPDHVGLRRTLLKALLLSSEAHERQRGQTMLRDLLEQLPDDADLLAVWAGVLLDERTPEATRQASALLQRVVQRNPRSVVAHLQLIELARQGEDLAQASELLTQALGDNPGNAELTMAHAMLEDHRNNARLARQLAESVRKNEPKNVPARNLLARLALRAGDTDLAQAFNNEALDLNPDDEIAHLHHAWILDAKGMRDEAVRGLESYRRTDAGRDRVAPLLALARLYLLKDDFATSEQCIDDAAQLAPENAGVLRGRLRWLAAQGQFDQILAEVAARQAEYPDDVPVLLDSGRILTATGKDRYMREARSLFEQVIALDQNHIEGNLGLAQVAYLSGDLEVSEQAYRRILAQDPYHLKALNDLAWILGVDQGELEEALRLADKGLARYPEDPHLLDTRGVLRTNRGRLADAQRDLEKCLSVLPANVHATRARALLHLGRVHVEQHQFTKAAGRLNEALAIDQQHNVLTRDEHAEIERLLNSCSGSPDERDAADQRR